MPVLNEASKFYVGSQPVSAVYAGANKVWPSWTPKSLAGLLVWLDASQISAITTQWPDLSGGNRHGLIYSSPPPVIRTNALNGLPVVRFKPNEGRVRSGSVFGLSGTGPYNYTLTYVTRMVGPAVGRAYTSQYPEGGNFLVGFHTSAIDCMYAEGWVSPGTGWPALPSPWKIYTGSGVHDGTTYTPRFYVNGVLTASGTGTGGIGNYYNISGYSPTGAEETCDCEVAELVVYNRRLPDNERQTVENYLKAKWGL